LSRDHASIIAVGIGANLGPQVDGGIAIELGVGSAPDLTMPPSPSLAVMR
jgi:hypothetical protein